MIKKIVNFMDNNLNNKTSNPKISFGQIKDEFVKQTNTDEEIDTENMKAFLQNVGIKSLCDKILKGQNWSNGSDIIYPIRRDKDNKIINIGFDIYNFASGEQDEFTLSVPNFIGVLADLRDKSIETSSENTTEYNELYDQMVEYLQDS